MPNTDPSMIECLIKRSGPTHVSLGYSDYVFTRNKAGRKVTQVLDQGHRDYLLALKDYQIYDGPTDAEVEAAQSNPDEFGLPDDLMGQAGLEAGAQNDEAVAQPAPGGVKQTQQDVGEEDEHTEEDGLILKKDGSPFSSHTAATTSAKRDYKLGEDQFQVEPYDEGYAVRKL